MKRAGHIRILGFGAKVIGVLGMSINEINYLFSDDEFCFLSIFYHFREPHERGKHLAEALAATQPLFFPAVADLKIHHQSLQRKRRRARRLHHPKLMRVGCSLGTCQVQNLNHRYWQLMGQMGKEESPIQLSNPHSFGWNFWTEEPKDRIKLLKGLGCRFTK